MFFKCKDFFKWFFSNFCAFKNHLENWLKTDSWASTPEIDSVGLGTGTADGFPGDAPAAGAQPTLKWRCRNGHSGRRLLHMVIPDLSTQPFTFRICLECPRSSFLELA